MNEETRNEIASSAGQIWEETAHLEPYTLGDLNALKIAREPQPVKAECVRAVAEGSRENRLAWDTMLAFSISHARQAPYPELAEWMEDVLRDAPRSRNQEAGNPRRRPQPRAAASKLLVRDQRIFAVLEWLTKMYDIDPTDNPCTAEKDSACHFAAEAAGVDYKTAEGIWTANQALMRADPILPKVPDR